MALSNSECQHTGLSQAADEYGGSFTGLMTVNMLHLLWVKVNTEVLPVK